MSFHPPKILPQKSDIEAELNFIDFLLHALNSYPILIETLEELAAMFPPGLYRPGSLGHKVRERISQVLLLVTNSGDKP